MAQTQDENTTQDDHIRRTQSQDPSLDADRDTIEDMGYTDEEMMD